MHGSAILLRRTLAVAVAGAALGGALQPAAAQTRTQLVVGITENIGSHNPVADSVAFMSSIWCQVYGCLVTFDFEKGDYAGMLAERWEVTDPHTWVFHLRRDIKSHDGHPLNAGDVVFSIDRIRTDRQSAQRANVAPIKSAEAVDRHTVKIVTHVPTAELLEYITDRAMVMQKRLIDQHGAREADRNHPHGYGPYKLKELVIGDRIVLEKNTDWPGIKADNPDTVIYRLMREAEQRVTALLNREIHIAQYVPPHLGPRIEQGNGVRVVTSASIEMMFLAMSPKVKPWDNKKLRQAVAWAIDREGIIKSVLQGQGQVLHGPLAKGQYGFDPELGPKYGYDPEKAKALVKEAGFPNGVDVELFTPVGRYINDKQAAEAITAMLTAVGIRTALKTPEWSTLWSDVQKGRTPFYYMGRGGMISPGPAITQYFQTGASPRIGYSNPEVDKHLAEARQTFDAEAYRKVVNRALSGILEDAPAHFLWQHKILYGVSNAIDFVPRPDHRVFGYAVTMKK